MRLHTFSLSCYAWCCNGATDSGFVQLFSSMFREHQIFLGGELKTCIDSCSYFCELVKAKTDRNAQHGL